MPRKKSKSYLDEDEPVIQLTSGHMVYATCALLVGALVFFLAGMVAGRFDSRRPAEDTTRTASASPETMPEKTPKADPSPTSTKPKPAPTPKKSTPSAKSPEGKQTSPRLPRKPVTLPPPPASPVKTQQPAASKSTAPNSKPEPSSTTKKAPSATVPPVGDVMGAPPRPEQQKTKTADAKAKAPTSGKAPETNSAPPKTEKIKTTEEKTPAKPSTPKPASNSAPAPTASSGKSTKEFPYAVQVAAVPANEPTKAKQLARELLEKEKMEVELRTSTDGKWIRLLAGAYRDQAEAKKACLELRKREAFKDCWMQKR